MTTKESQSRDSRTVDCIHAMFRVHRRLKTYASAVQVSIEDAAIVLRGRLPSGELKADLLPAIRQAGFLGRVCDCVEIEAQVA